MPSRLIRDEMLESESVLSLPVEARWFYVTILLSADDLGLFEATSFKLARRADIRRESGEALLLMLADADLVRLYEVNGKRFGFIPRFRQRLQIKRLRYPQPPIGLFQDDEDALNKINNLTSNPTVGQRMANSYPTAAQPSEPEPEPEPELKPKVKPKEERIQESTQKVAKPVDVSSEVWQSFQLIRRAKKAPITVVSILGLRREAVKAGLTLEQAMTTCCERGWAGFKAEWVQDRPQFTNPADSIHTTVPGRKERDPALLKAEQDSQNAAPPSAEIRARMAEILGRKV